MFRRFAYAFLAAALVLAGLAIAMTGPITSSALSTTVYGCFNAGGHEEASTVGLSPQPCAHATDTVQSWTVARYVPPVVTTTTRAATTTTAGPVTTTTAVAAGTTTTAAAVTTTTAATSGMWLPTDAHSLTWDWVISTVPTAHAGLDVIDTDGFDNTAADVAAWHAFSTKAVCYIDLGTAEPGRPDLNLIPAGDTGSSVQGFASEHWLNIADLNGLKPLINERVAMCATKGFDAVEPDDVDGYSNSTGFPLTAANQVAYNEYIASAVHAAGMSVLLKNDVDQTATLAPFFDFALDEQCNQYSECGTLAPFAAAGKAVFNAEYSGSTATFCPADAAAKINGAKFSINLDGTGRTSCPAWP